MFACVCVTSNEILWYSERESLRLSRTIHSSTLLTGQCIGRSVRCHVNVAFPHFSLVFVLNSLSLSRCDVPVSVAWRRQDFLPFALSLALSFAFFSFWLMYGVRVRFRMKVSRLQSAELRTHRSLAKNYKENCCFCFTLYISLLHTNCEHRCGSKTKKK